MKKASHLQAETAKLQTELAELQARCPHKEQHIRWCPHAKNFKWECKECLARLAYPSIQISRHTCHLEFNNFIILGLRASLSYTLFICMIGITFTAVVVISLALQIRKDRREYFEHHRTKQYTGHEHHHLHRNNGRGVRVSDMR